MIEINSLQSLCVVIVYGVTLIVLAVIAIVSFTGSPNAQWEYDRKRRHAMARDMVTEYWFFESMRKIPNCYHLLVDYERRYND